MQEYSGKARGPFQRDGKVDENREGQRFVTQTPCIIMRGAMPKKNSRTEQREKLRKEFWPQEDAWAVGAEVGWFRAPRTLPLILELIASKDLSGRNDPTRVYLELLARHIDGGIVEM